MPEPFPGLFHKGATRSFKQVAFGEANLQLTLHEHTTKEVEGETWVRIEPDIDYFKDAGAHALLEVLPNLFGGRPTNPAAVYVLRWIAGRHAGVPEFDPPSPSFHPSAHKTRAGDPGPRTWDHSSVTAFLPTSFRLKAEATCLLLNGFRLQAEGSPT